MSSRYLPARRRALVPFACAAAFIALNHVSAHAQAQNTIELERLSRVYRQQLESARTAPLYLQLLQAPDAAQRAINDEPGIQLMFIRDGGVPAFFKVDNLNAARTVRTYDIWPGGVGGGTYGLDGSATSAGNLAVWDGGGVRLTHQEFGGRVTQVDGPISHIQHATHVAGTMVAAGVSGSARGMSYAAPLHAYDWNFDTSEMATAGAGGLQVSNHSYGFATGWEPIGANWYWFGDMSVSTTEDYGFGFYDDSARDYDVVAFNAPNYLICVSSGNDRNDNGPGAGGGHFHWTGSWTFANDTHGADGQTGGYDTISWTGNAKNILTVGAVNDIVAGYSMPSDVVQTAFSSWGPCDDGRIKPDIVANGAGLTSANNNSDAGYASLSGTSMSSPNAAGSINLIAQAFETQRGSIPRSATLKALVINAADEAGFNPGPDYQNGWGLLNTRRALDIVYAGPSDDLGVIESTLNDGDTHQYFFASNMVQDIRVTLVWTDPAGTVSAASLDPTTPKLVNDLDVVLTDPNAPAIVFPWNLDKALPGNAATKGNNTVDNVEQIDFASAPSGTYVVTVSHKGSLTNGQQAYSLVYRGMHEAPTPVQGAARTPNLWIGDARPNPVAGVATIDFGLAEAGNVSIHVYDVAGRRVATILDRGSRGAGAGTVTLDTSKLASGIYFVRLESATETASRKITVVK